MFAYNQVGGGKSAWLKHVEETHRELKKTRPEISYKAAMQEAKKTYEKSKPSKSTSDNKKKGGLKYDEWMVTTEPGKRAGRPVTEATGLYQMGYGNSPAQVAWRQAVGGAKRRSARRSPRVSLDKARKILREYYAKHGSLQGVRARMSQVGAGRKSARRSARKSARKSTRRSTRRSARRSKKRSARRSGRKSARKSARKSTRRSARKSMRRSARRSKKRSARRSKKRSARRSGRRSAKRSKKRSARKSARRSARRSRRRSARRSPLRFLGL